MRHGRLRGLVPFISVIRSARCMARIREKWPVSEERRSFCLSYAVVAGRRCQRFCSALPAEGERGMLGTGTYTTLARPFGHRHWWRRTRFSWTWRRHLWWVMQSVWEEAGGALAVSRDDSCRTALSLVCEMDGGENNQAGSRVGRSPTVVARWWYWSGCADIIALHGWLRLSGHPAAEQSSRTRLKLFLACEGANAVISYAGRPVSGLDRHPCTREGPRLGSSLPCLKSQLAAPDLPDLSCYAVALTTQHHVTET